jgi:hypothetical protein
LQRFPKKKGMAESNPACLDEKPRSGRKGVDLKTVDVWFQDEARVGQQGTVTG